MERELNILLHTPHCAPILTCAPLCRERGWGVVYYYYLRQGVESASLLALLSVALLMSSPVPPPCTTLGARHGVGYLATFGTSESRIHITQEGVGMKGGTEQGIGLAYLTK